MAEYNTFKYIPTLPEGTPISTWLGTMVYTWSDRSDITAGVCMFKDGAFESIWTVHSRMPLAESKAKRLAKENTIAGRTFVAVPLTLQPRNKTYFSGQSFGNAEEMLVLDTADWSMEMWGRLRYSADTTILAKHFAEGIHDFEEKEVWRGSKRLKLPVCKTCSLLREELIA